MARIGRAPAALVVEESARHYVEGDKIALILGAIIRRLGVMTTDLPLVADAAEDETSVLDF